MQKKKTVFDARDSGAFEKWFNYCLHRILLPRVRKGKKKKNGLQIRVFPQVSCLIFANLRRYFGARAHDICSLS